MSMTRICRLLSNTVSNNANDLFLGICYTILSGTTAAGNSVVLPITFLGRILGLCVESDYGDSRTCTRAIGTTTAALAGNASAFSMTYYMITTGTAAVIAPSIPAVVTATLAGTAAGIAAEKLVSTLATCFFSPRREGRVAPLNQVVVAMEPPPIIPFIYASPMR